MKKKEFTPEVSKKVYLKNSMEETAKTAEVTPDEKDQVSKDIETVNKANESTVLMSILCEKMGLRPQETTHQAFIQTFSDLQKESLEAQKRLQAKFISTPVPPKMRKTRQLKNV